MELILNSIICFLIGLSPVLFITIYGIYEKSLDKIERNLYQDISLIITQYLLVISQPKEMILIITIPLFIGLLEKRKTAIILCSIILTFLSIKQLNILYPLLEYLIIYITYILYKQNKISKKIITILFLVIKITFLNIINTKLSLFNTKELIDLTIIYTLTILILSICYKICKMTIRLFMSIKELEQNKQIKTTLFKISHEIKNPLAVCKGYLDMYDYTNQTHIKKYIPIVKSEIEKSLVILHDFLNLSKLNLNLEIIDINLLIEECLENIELLLKTNNIKINKNLLDDELYIKGDFIRLHQVLVNIIKNSVEAMYETKQKEIYITTKINKKIIIEIEDTGPGIDKEMQEKIKEPFYTTKTNGTGLGIPLSIEIIKAHNGNIEYTNGVGTKVTIELPIEK